MLDFNRDKFFDAIYDFLLESMTDEKARNQTNVMVDQIFEITRNIQYLIDLHKDSKKQDKKLPISLSKKFHTLKNLLLYGDFYYESDLCEDIEIELRKSKNINNIVSIFDELVDSLKM